MVTVGLTGSLASGKSEAAKMFKKLGARIFDADAAAKRAVNKGTPVYKAIVKIFGKEFLQKNGEIDRRKLGKRVFSHPNDLKKLNILIHPGVIFEIFKLKEAVQNKKGVLVLDVPLLFESKMDRLVDFTVVVTSPKETSLSRAAKKGVPRPLAKKILSSQWPAEKKARRADFVIKNDGTVKRLRERVREVFDAVRDANPQV